MKPAKFIIAISVVVLAGIFSGPSAPGTAAAQTSDLNFDITFDHVALSVPNIGESSAWYQKMFGFREVRRGGQPNGMQTALLQRGNIDIELFQISGAAPLPESRRNPSEDFRTHGVKHFAFEVKDIRAVLAQLQARGVKIAFELRDNPGTAYAFVSDNAGNTIELIEHK